MLWYSETVLVKKWNSDGGRVLVEQCTWWNSEVEQCWWNSGKVMVKHRGKTVEQCWWNGVVEQ